MDHEWHELTDLIGDRPFRVTRVRLDNDVSIEGSFELSPLARLRYEDQVFVSEFIRNHGSIKDMERSFGISYPTVKNRLNRIADQLKLVVDVVRPPAADDTAPASTTEILDLLERGEISTSEAMERLGG